MNGVEVHGAYPGFQQILQNSQYLDILPGGFSIATDASCKTILHNTITAEFLRIDPSSQPSPSTQGLTEAKLYHRGKPIGVEDLPLQRAAWYGEVIDKFELEFVWDDGVSKIAQWSARPVWDEKGNICGSIANVVDITDMVMLARKLKKVEADAKKLEERFEAAIDLMPDGFGLLSPVHNGEGKVIDFLIDYVNEAHCRRARATKDQLIGRHLSEGLRNAQVLQAYCDVAETGQPLRKEPIRYSNGTNKQVDFALEARAVKIGDGLAVFWHDITERKLNEDSLRLSEERFAKAFFSSPYMKSIITLADNRYVHVNEAFLQGHERTGEEVIGKTPVDLGASPEKLAEFITLFTRDHHVRDLEVSINTKTGNKMAGLLSAVPISIDGQDCILNEYYNITDLKKTQAEMARLDRLNLVGQMAAGIGHEMRNPMTTVRGYLQLIGDKQENQTYRPAFDLMISELDRANSILTEFLSLARNQLTKTTSQNLNSVLQNIFPLLEANAISQNKQIEFLPGNIPDIQINVKEIHQLVLNLCQNGLEAMNEQAQLTLRTYVEGRFVVFSVQDEGCGIAYENLEKLGTPFFTTKDNGTGLGLATSYSVAARHNAHINVETGPQGTTFFVRFDQITGED